MSLDTSGEREANHIATRAIGAGVAEPLLRTGLSRARLHTGPEAADSAAALDAAAFAIGDDIVFGAGRYRPDTPAGQWLIAHEAAHVGQQARDGRPALRRQPADVVEMPPLTVTSTLNPVEKSVSHLDRLRDAGVTPLTPTISRLPADVDRNSPDPAARLPFTPNGWDGGDILLRLGQFDRMPGTDSDAMRCVQAVGMAARVPDGPAAVVSYLQALILQGMLRPKATDRQRTATEVLEHVIGRIETRRATFGDMAWAQEAMHDLFYNDVSGTPEPDILPAIAPAMDLTKTLQRMDLWCDTPQQVMAQATQLQPGEQLIIEAWTVSLNTAFDQVSEQGIEVREGESVVVNVNGRLVRIRRIPMNQRPPHTALDLTRDSKTGHQLLILKDAADGALRLYEPEITASGQHLEKLAADGSNFVGYFHDQPAFGMYHYIQIIGKLRPGSVTPSAAWP
jgi:microcompartment protein CcmK/EutM